MDAVETLAQMPTIGRIDTRFSKGKTIYYSFVVHPKYRIVYCYTQRTLYIVAIRATMMK
ncbi:MAG: type II toxin-antitoxin system RelE/ParE family toxin [Bacteroidaceae bacterium]|nr:type II toxin-antitoxin system RelE/ParE family toxin [Bacteroidaceae bacterium]